MNKFKKSIDNINLSSEARERIKDKVINHKGENYMRGFKYSKLIIAGVVAATIIVGINVAKNVGTSQSGGNVQGGSPQVGEVYVPDKEFNNIDFTKLDVNITKLEIRSHMNDNKVKDIDDEAIIQKLIGYIKASTPKKMTDSVYESIAKSQSEGKSITLRFVDKDNKFYSIRINLDLNLINLNGEYNDVDSDMVNNIKSLFNNINDLYEGNTLAQ